MSTIKEPSSSERRLEIVRNGFLEVAHRAGAKVEFTSIGGISRIQLEWSLIGQTGQEDPDLLYMVLTLGHGEQVSISSLRSAKKMLGKMMASLSTSYSMAKDLMDSLHSVSASTPGWVRNVCGRSLGSSRGQRKQKSSYRGNHT